jgi:diguanylate cyclase (GGDEF)-like protein
MTRRSRARRGRVLLVGGAAPLDASILDWPADERSTDRLDALARVVASSAREPVIAAVFASDELAADAALVRECFERVDPSVELFIWRPDPAQSPPPAGFTEISADADGLRNSILKALGFPAEEPESEAPADESPTPGTAFVPVATEPPITTPSIRETAEAPRRRFERVETTSSLRPDANEPPSIEILPAIPLEPLGDLDLVRGVLAGGGRLAELAMSLLRQRLGSADLSFLPPDAAVGGRDVAAVEVRVGGSNAPRLGWLASGSVPASALAPWSDWLATWLELDRRHEERGRQATTDELTGVGNRRAFETVLAETLAAARPQRRPVTLMVFDIDNFKTYNDRFGHEAGDEVLRETVQLLRSTIRRGDHVFRIGGDEFVVIFSDPDGPRNPGTSPPDSVDQIVRRFQSQVFRMRLPKLGLDAPGTVTVSAGLATYPWDGLDAKSLLSHADQLAMQSKRSGKNLITFGPGAREHLEGK